MYYVHAHIEADCNSMACPPYDSQKRTHNALILYYYSTCMHKMIRIYSVRSATHIETTKGHHSQKILCGQLNCLAKLADISIRYSSHPQGVNLSTKNLCLFHRDNYTQYTLTYVYFHIPVAQFQIHVCTTYMYNVIIYDLLPYNS